MTALSRRPDLQGRLVRLHLLVLCGMTTLLVAVQTAHLYGEARARLGERALITSRIVARLPVVLGDRAAPVALTDLWPELARVAAPGRHQNPELTLRGQPVLVNLEPLAGGGFVAVFRDRAEALALAEDLIRTPIEWAAKPARSERMRLGELLRREEVKRPSGRRAGRGGEVPDCWRNKRQSL